MKTFQEFISEAVSNVTLDDGILHRHRIKVDGMSASEVAAALSKSKHEDAWMVRSKHHTYHESGEVGFESAGHRSIAAKVMRDHLKKAKK